jgi:hypothetical protein
VISNLAITATTLLVGFIVFFVGTLPYAGFTTDLRFAWHPAGKVAESFVLGSRKTASFFILSLCAGLCALAIFCNGHTAALANTALFFILAPLPYFVIDAIRKDASLYSKEIVFHNVFSPITTRHERVLRGGLAVEERPRIAFYLDDQAWTEIRIASTDDRRFLNQFHITGGLYIAEATNETLQLFDSLGLYPYLIHPDNRRAMQAFEEALFSYFNESPPASARPAVLPPKIVIVTAGPPIRPAQTPVFPAAPTVTAPVPAPRVAPVTVVPVVTVAPLVAPTVAPVTPPEAEAPGEAGSGNENPFNFDDEPPNAAAPPEPAASAYPEAEEPAEPPQPAAPAPPTEAASPIAPHSEAAVPENLHQSVADLVDTGAQASSFKQRPKRGSGGAGAPAAAPKPKRTLRVDGLDGLNGPAE